MSNAKAGHLVANSERAKCELGRQPQYADLDVIVGHAWVWELKLAKLQGQVDFTQSTSAHRLPK